MFLCGNSTCIIELIVDRFLANGGIGIVSLLCVSSLKPVGLILVLFVVRKGEFLGDDLGVNQT